MTAAVSEATLPLAALDAVLAPRDGALVAERALGAGRFELRDGPFHAYRRTVAVEHLPGSRVHVTQTVEFRLAIPWFAFLFVLPTKRALARVGPVPSRPWWAPPQRLDARASSALGALGALSIVAGYLNTLLTQTITFAADEFGAGEGVQGLVGTAVRVGGFLSFAVIAAADRRGRRTIVLAAAAIGCAFAVTGAFSPSIAFLAATQVLGRPFATALLVVILIVAAEEMPAGSRAYAVSILAMAGGLGAGFCVMALPLADLGTRGWRAVYLLPVLGLLLVRRTARHLPESRRFVAPHGDATLAGHARRLWLMAVSGFLRNLFIAPASFFQNRFLDTERGFSAARISLLTLVTNTPAGLGIVVGGRIADVRGRKVVGITALTVGLVCSVAFFYATGWPLWVWSLAGAMVSAMGIPALGVYDPELFPTALRGKANAITTVASLAGSAVGLLLAGFLSDAWDRFAPVMTILGAGPLALAVLVAVAYPETARRELEDINPEDRPVRDAGP